MIWQSQSDLGPRAQSSSCSAGFFATPGSPLTGHISFPAQKSYQLRALLLLRLSLPRFACLYPFLWARPCNPMVLGLCLLLLPSCSKRNVTEPLGEEYRGRWCDKPAQRDGAAALRAASHPSHPNQSSWSRTLAAHPPAEALPKVPALPRWRTLCPELWIALHLISTTKPPPCKKHGVRVHTPFAEKKELGCSGPIAGVPWGRRKQDSSTALTTDAGHKQRWPSCSLRGCWLIQKATV